MHSAKWEHKWQWSTIMWQPTTQNILTECWPLQYSLRISHMKTVGGDDPTNYSASWQDLRNESFPVTLKHWSRNKEDCKSALSVSQAFHSVNIFVWWLKPLYHIAHWFRARQASYTVIRSYVHAAPHPGSPENILQTCNNGPELGWNGVCVESIVPITVHIWL